MPKPKKTSILSPIVADAEKASSENLFTIETFENFLDKMKAIYKDKNIFTKIPVEGTGYIISDLHGNLKALDRILAVTDFHNKIASGEKVFLIFLGDYIDKGKENLALLYTVLTLKTSYPENIILLRGNHETTFFLNRFMTFKKELRQCYGRDFKLVTRIFSEIFDCLPVIAVSQNGIVAMHGGPPHSLTLYGLTKIGLHEILWSNIKKNRPKNGKKIPRSMYRLGKGRNFSILDVEEFLNNLGMTFLFRGHSHTMRGIEITSRNIMTVISANSLERFGASLGRRGQSGIVEIDLGQKLKDISQVKTIFLS